jgi:hypothetical protein
VVCNFFSSSSMSSHNNKASSYYMGHFCEWTLIWDGFREFFGSGFWGSLWLIFGGFAGDCFSVARDDFDRLRGWLRVKAFIKSEVRLGLDLWGEIKGEWQLNEMRRVEMWMEWLSVMFWLGIVDSFWVFVGMKSVRGKFRNWKKFWSTFMKLLNDYND